jgi:Histidine phosphatase superfamily (branch 1)
VRKSDICRFVAGELTVVCIANRSRFPGGESYKDLIKRLESPIIDMEQQTAPVLIVSHVSVLQALIAYFRQSPADQCMNIEVPMHTVLKFTPSRGGGWVESRHELLPDEGILNSSKAIANVTSESELSALSCSDHVASSPIWGDHVHVSPVSPRITRPL